MRWGHPAGDLPALPTTQPSPGPGPPGARGARFQTNHQYTHAGFLVSPLPSGLSFSAVPSQGISGLSAAKRRDHTWAPYKAARLRPQHATWGVGGPVVLVRRTLEPESVYRP